MQRYQINLYINSMTEGFICLIDHLANEEVEIPVELDFEYSPAEKMTHEYPGCDEELELVSVLAFFGDIDIETISNLEEFTKEAIKVMHKEGL